MSLETLVGILPCFFPFSVYLFTIRIMFVLLTSVDKKQLQGRPQDCPRFGVLVPAPVWLQVSSRPRAWEAEAQHSVDTELV